MDVTPSASLAVGAIAIFFTVSAHADPRVSPPTGNEASPTPAAGTLTLNEPKANVEAPKPAIQDDIVDRLIARPSTIAEVEAGGVALPGAPISASQRGGDILGVGKVGKGDATLQVGAHLLYRFKRKFIVGAGFFFTPLPTADKQYGGLASLSREHSRAYFFIGVEGRYVPIRYRSFEGWVGLQAGGVVVADRFHTDAPPVPPILGYPDSTVQTEGFGAGLQIGATYYVSDNFIAGASFRAYHWILPESRECTPIGDCATIGGAVEVLQLGLTIGYRLSL